MLATVRAASAATAILLALGSPAAAMEEKSTKPRLAVLEFKNRAEAQLQVDSVQWGEWIADVERPQAAGRGIDIATVDGEIVNPGQRKAGTAIGQAIGNRAAEDNEDAARGGDPDRPVIIGSVPNPRGAASVPETGDEVLVGMEHGDAASGQATGKRQHMPVLSDAEGPIRMRAYYDAPLQRGSVMLRLAQPWAGCAVGDRFNGVYLTSGVTHRYRLDGAEVASCGGSTVTINYTRFASTGTPAR